MTKHDINVGSDWLLGEIDQFSEKIESSHASSV